MRLLPAAARHKTATAHVYDKHVTKGTGTLTQPSPAHAAAPHKQPHALGPGHCLPAVDNNTMLCKMCCLLE
jgi:hypothetical protein